MNKQLQNSRHLPAIIACCLLTLLLSACSLFGNDSTKTAQPTPTPKASSNSNTTPLTTYSGDGYTVGYPQGWKITQKTQAEGKQVIFTDPAGITTFIVEDGNNPGGILPTSTLIDVGIALFKENSKHYQAISVPATTTVAGQSWDQRSGTADVTEQGVTANAKQVTLATNHPASVANTKIFAIFYASPTFTFDAENSSVFQPMLQTFKFA